MKAHTCTVLLVDKDAAFITETAELLTALGFVVAGTAQNGQDALRLAEELRPDTVLMGISLPGEFGGLAACERIQKKLAIPVVLMTGHGNIGYKYAAEEMKPAGFVFKPYLSEQIQALLLSAAAQARIAEATSLPEVEEHTEHALPETA